MKNLKVVFMGTPSFAVPVLEELIKKTNVCLVVCQESKKKDRKGNIIDPDTKVLADSYNIPVIQPTNIKEDYNKIIELDPDIIITCAYGQIIPKELLEYPKYGCINIHGSLLPKLRGGAPIHWAIINGDKKVGVTIMKMSTKMDAGDIISQASINITDDDTLEYVYDKLSYVGRDLLLETLPSIINKTAKYTKQKEEEVTFGLNIKPSDEKIDFNKKGVDLKNLVRGLCSIPGAYCYLDNKRLKIYKVNVINEQPTSSPGTIVKVTKNSIICTSIDSLIEITDIKLEGKKRCLVKDYLNGIDKNSLIGKVLK